jgi:hypothetical protein
MDDKKLFFMPYVLRIDRAAGAFAKRQEIDGIQQIGLTHTVQPEKAIQLGGKAEFGLLYVFIIEQEYTLQYHVALMVALQK